jgi:diguanylate cyclase (GGDEF)-like protein/PAS domain S-box-containing protein
MNPGASEPAPDLDFELLFRAGPAGSMVTGSDDTILEINDAFTAWTGHRREDLVGTSFLRLLPAGDRILFATHMQPVLDLTGRIPPLATTILGADRATLPALLTASRVSMDSPVTQFLMGPRLQRSFEEAQLISAVHRAESSDSRRQEAEDGLEYLATHDALTGLLNRAGLIAALADAREDSTPAPETTVYWLGLDHFRVINESLGRTAGDDILTIVSGRLVEHYDDRALLARVGGDEFVVAVPGIAGMEREQEAEAILQLVAKPLVVEDLEIVISASVGVAASGVAVGPDAAARHRATDALLRSAGTGMHEAKSAGRNRWKQVIPASVDESVINEIRLLGEIRAAIVGDQLRLDYQPQLDLRTGRLHGFEALLRWDHPERGLIAPSGFIDVAEKTGLIVQLGTWACGTAIAETARLLNAPGADPGRMSVNISARQLGDSTFAATLEPLLQAHDLDPARLTLELTETGLITDTARTRDNLQRLHDIGVHLSIDDFGTGHAGFTYLSDFPIDEIKIDRSFVSRLDASPEATAIVVSCIELAHALNVTVVAEGVETAAQLARLTELGCDIAQGFYYSRPLLAAAVEHWMESQLP